MSSDWDAPVGKLRREIAGPVSDASCAAIVLSVEPTPRQTVRLAAMTWDGRYAEREVLRPSALVATALGLVASIPEESAPVSEGSPAAPVATTSRPVVAVEVDGGIEPAPAPLRPSRLIALSMGGAVGARITAPTPLELIDIEGRFDALVRGRWLLSASLHYAPTVGPHPDDTEYDELVGSIGAGRRIPLGDSALDVSIVPAVALVTMRWNVDQPDAQSRTSTAFRVGLSARWSKPLGGSWRFTVTADVDAAPFAFRQDPSLGTDAPALPVWTGGLRVGASGELL